MISMINRIVDLAITVSQTTKHDIYASYRAHINAFEIEIYEGGWVSGKKSTKYLKVFLDIGPLEQRLRALYEIKKAIEELKNE